MQTRGRIPYSMIASIIVALINTQHIVHLCINVNTPTLGVINFSAFIAILGGIMIVVHLVEIKKMYPPKKKAVKVYRSIFLWEVFIIATSLINTFLEAFNCKLDSQIMTFVYLSFNVLGGVFLTWLFSNLKLKKTRKNNQ